MNPRRILFALLVVVCGIQYSAAETTERVLAVSLTNGTYQYYELAKQPIVTFQGSNMQIKGTDIDAEIARSSVKEFHFIPFSTEGIHSVQPTNALSFRHVDANTIEVGGAAATTAALYNAAGQCIGSRVVTDGVARFSLQNLPAGTYILRAAGQSIKVQK